MKTSRLLPLGIVAGLLLVANAMPASVARFETLGDNTYTCTREASTSFDRNVDQLTAEAKEDAAKFCATKGKQPKVISIAVHKAWPTLGFSRATVTFKALEAGDSELADNTPVPVVTEGRKPRKAVEAGPVEAPVDELYNGLLKLDELRKRGLLTDEEFQSEKKKLLNRSK
ncbi:MAG TPA: SHOCT domain-containing protein [Opitutus sp.]|nr:SHOCT domain-containing protein [Opitutus sp.]